MYHVCLLENLLCWKKAKKFLKINDIALFVIYLNYRWVHIPPKILPIGLFLDCRQILQYCIWCKLIPQCHGQLMGSGCASILVPPGDPVFSFIIQHEIYICRAEMIGIIGATVSWFYIFKTLILKYFIQWYATYNDV